MPSVFAKPNNDADYEALQLAKETGSYDSVKHVYRCPYCDGLLWARRALICHGTVSDRHNPFLMRVVDAEPEMNDTPDLLIA